ncbi:Ff.00g017330.m01.CDS01 [Fusarium sp. VM40]|nr:Ff.00g017330.m01.CDS01 [Fusarium sp. VM40]
MNLLLLLVTWACLIPQVFCYDATQFLSQIPQCAGNCLLYLASNSTCGLDVECLCADTKLQTQVKSCVQANCLPMEALSTLKATSVACKYPVRDKHTQFDVLAVVLCVVTGIMVGLRFFEKLRYEKRFRPEDYLVAFYFALTLTNTITCIYGLSGNGLGRDTWIFSPDTITTFLMYLYIGQTIYATEVFITKIYVTLFYLRIFPVPNVRRLLWGTISLSVVCLVAFNILAITQCQPISFFWQG